MRVLVTGDREWRDDRFLWKSLDNLRAQFPDLELIEGGARGADRLARQWAVDRGVPFRTFPADWGRYGKGAGVVRNKQMLVEGQPDVVFAFHDQILVSRGTRNMVEQAEAAGVQVVLLSHPEVVPYG